MPVKQVVEMNSKLTAALRAEKIPVIGFVNEGRLYRIGEVDDRIRALSMWPEAGFDLGNHTFSHASLNHTPLAEWELNVLRGDTVTRLLLDEHHLKFQYFRYPYLDMGADLDTRRKAEAFLSEHGYRIAPVTLDPWDWYFARVYEDARSRQDAALEHRVVEAWLAHSDEIFAYYERKSRALFGYEPAQVILLHDNWMEADHISELLALLRKRGYQFVSLDDALKDPAYSSPDTYISDDGASSIDHWALTRGKQEPAEAEPAIPAWVRDRVDALAAKARP